MSRVMVPARRTSLPVLGVLAVLSSLAVGLALPTQSAHAADPGKPGFLAFTSDRNSELAAVPLADDLGGGVKPGTPVRLTTRPEADCVSSRVVAAVTLIARRFSSVTGTARSSSSSPTTGTASAAGMAAATASWGSASELPFAVASSKQVHERAAATRCAHVYR